MTKDQVIKEIGKERWGEFEKWMKGQTVGVNKDGSINYYEHDVLRFMSDLRDIWWD